MSTQPDYNRVQQFVDAILTEQEITTPPVNPVAIARNKGLDVVFVGFSDGASEISGFYDFEDNTIFVNRDEYPLRQTFTVAHELGHKILHEEWARSSDYQVLLRDTTKQRYDYREQEANAFAAGLLMPKFLMDQYWRKHRVEQLSQLFAVSVPAIQHRLSFLYGVIPGER